MSAVLKIDGWVAPGYDAVRDALAAHPTGGSTLTVLRDGTPVVELREGWRDAARTRSWATDTLVNVYSVGKPVIALALWEPGTVAAEHALTYGHLLGELVRRVDGRMPGQFVAEEIAGPWGLDFGFGLGLTDIARCAELEYDRADWPVRSVGIPGSVRARAVQNPHGTRDLAVVNSDAWRSAQVPAVNLHSTATAIARMYAGLLAGGILDGHRLLTPSLVESMVSAQYTGEDLFIERPVVWGLSVQLEADGTWGVGGLGGNAGWADPATGHAVAYVTRRLGDFEQVDAIEAALRDS
jgi:CubicO group peptidase (beta-lactamase class C family)